MQKLAVAEWCLEGRGVQAIELAAALGFDGMHLGFTEPGDERLPYQPGWLDDIASACQRLDCRVFCLAVNVVERYGLFDDIGRDKCLAAVKSAIHAAEALGVPLVYVPSFHKSEIVSGAQLAQTADFFNMLCSSTDSDVLLASENTLNATDNLRLLAQVDSTRFKILLDVYNPRLWGHSSKEIVQRVGACLAPQVHIKDGCEGRMGNVRLGEGEGEIEAVLSELAERGTVEVLVLENDYTRSPASAVASDIGYLARFFPEACRGALAIVKQECSEVERFEDVEI